MSCPLFLSRVHISIIVTSTDRVFCWRTLCWTVLLLAGSSTGFSTGAERVATPIEQINCPDGFQVELLRSAQEDEDSWISMTFDDQGRIIVGLDTVGLARLTLSNNSSAVHFSRIDNTLQHCRGVLYAHGALYVSATNSKGFYRLRDVDHDGQFEEKVLLKPMDYRSRYGHGTNQIILGPDNMIYVVNGNDVSFPEGTSSDSPYQNPQVDRLLPLPQDAGHDNRVGHIVRTDPDGKTWEVLCGGLRNQVDIAFNSDGELFTFDADMEYDVGLPWYRPTRVNHLVSGGEYGWKWGSAKWPTYFPDSLPTTLDVGLSSPTGLIFGYASRFPPKYQSKLFMADWQNGRILMVELTPRGASYDATCEVFAEGGPLNICDMTFGTDGALYFITGGRGSQSGLYRVQYVGLPTRNPDIQPSTKISGVTASQSRDLRHQLEAFHSRSSPQAIELVWPHLASRDRWIRFAARLAVERQPLSEWRDRALAETDLNASLVALLALARAGEKSDQKALLEVLQRLPWKQLDDSHLLEALRVLELSLIRHGKPTCDLVSPIAKQLNAIYPHHSSSANRQLRELLAYLQTAGVIEKTLAFLGNSTPQEEQVHAANALTYVTEGWTLETQRVFLRWLVNAREFHGAQHVPVAIDNIKTNFLTSLNEQEKQTLETTLTELRDAENTAEQKTVYPVVQRWTIEDLLADLPGTLDGRSFASAREAIAMASCLKCHQIGDEGTAVGPNLTRVGRRFDSRAILESILTPSKVIDPKYRYTAYVLTNGKVVVGQTLHVSANQIQVKNDALSQEPVNVARDRIEESFPAEISPMPTGLIDILSQSQIYDLLAYLLAEGNPSHKVFQSR